MSAALSRSDIQFLLSAFALTAAVYFGAIGIVALVNWSIGQ